jgi:hypothetical protein
MSKKIQKGVEQYVETQLDCRVISSKPEQNYSELGVDVTIWNVKTNDGSWWVASSDSLPMNLYPQDKAYYFSTDEVFSFHFGLMLRLLNDDSSRAESIIDDIAKGVELMSQVRRKLDLTAEKLLQAVELEEIQAIGVMCRETLLTLMEHIFSPAYLKDNEEIPKKSDFKNKCKITLDSLLAGSDNAELRDHMRKLSYSAWEYSNEVTHSTSKSNQDAAIALSLCTAVVSVFENLLDKFNDPVAELKCKRCGSKHLSVAKNDENSQLLIICDRCNYGFLKPE